MVDTAAPRWRMLRVPECRQWATQVGRVSVREGILLLPPCEWRRCARSSSQRRRSSDLTLELGELRLQFRRRDSFASNDRLQRVAASLRVIVELVDREVFVVAAVHRPY
jgi:hypothetical protein